MRSILVLSSTYPRWNGDTEPAFVHSLCRQLASQYQVIVLVPHYPGALRMEILDGVLVYRFRYFLTFAETLAYRGGIITNLKNNALKWLLVPFFLASQLIHLVVLARKYRICLIHAHWIIPQGILAVLARNMLLGNIQVLSTSHGADLFALRAGILQKLKCWVIRQSDHVTVVSNAMKLKLQEMGCDPRSVSVQPMGVDLKDSFIPDPKASKQTDLIYVGRLVEKKGVATLIEALSLLQLDFPTLKLSIVGDGPEKDALEALTGRFGLAEQVDFAGAVENSQVPDWYRSASIAVIPSIVAADGDQEGLGLVAVEALGCGCATIVSDLPALGDVVRDGENGLVFHAGDARDLATKIRQILSDNTLYEKLVRSSSRSVVSQFDWRQVGRSYIELIEHCLEATTHR
jgi:glycosyltransferase involved in cell wall biosynthesis